ncbi:hypothetical protein [Reinekea sp. G2M2-21]|uniref:hypothetical protein n=1 Tax=Reinekea sp. G2M2-21 TaxID=2788942 RepID=UPI0018AC50D5|nr:hypothetical protein [Reinekea sp. G2M2-21]
MDLLGLVCNLAFALLFMIIASKKMFKNSKLWHLLGYVVVAYIIMPIPTIGTVASIVFLIACLVKWADATGIEAVGYAMVSFILATILGDLTAYIIVNGGLPPSPAEYFSS